MIKPIYLLDLDDTVFHSVRKLIDLGENGYKVAALDKNLNPRSFMTQTQANYLQWLLASTILIPVTGRTLDQTARVLIDFTSWKIMSHGAVIATAKNKLDEKWSRTISAKLLPHQKEMRQKQALLTALFAKRKLNAFARINYEYDDLAVSLIVKHTKSADTNELYAIIDLVNDTLNNQAFYLQRNDATITWLPKSVEKGRAVSYLLEKLGAKENATPVIGFGDSISDHSFLTLCDWLAMPSKSQISDALAMSIS